MGESPDDDQASAWRDLDDSGPGSPPAPQKPSKFSIDPKQDPPTPPTNQPNHFHDSMATQDFTGNSPGQSPFETPPGPYSTRETRRDGPPDGTRPASISPGYVPRMDGPLTVESLGAELLGIGLLTKMEWNDAVWRSADHNDVAQVIEKLSKTIVRSEEKFPGLATALTDYQIAEIYAGRTHDLRIADLIILHKLGGESGQGEVFAVYDAKLNSLDIVKRMKVVGLDSSESRVRNEARRRFQQEAQLLRQMKSDYFPTVYNFGFDQDKAYIHMEYIRGQTVHEYVDASHDKNIPFPIDEAIWITIESARALDIAHRQREPVVHRDIKPANLMVTPEHGLKVLDLGIARVISSDKASTSAISKFTTGGFIGTPVFAAPEQWDDAKKVGPASDVFGLGKTLYWILTRIAMPGSPQKQIRAVRKDCPKKLDEIVAKMCAYDIPDRYQSMSEVIEALNELQGTKPRDVKSKITNTRGGNSSSRATVAFVSLLALSILGGVLGAVVRPDLARKVGRRIYPAGFVDLPEGELGDKRVDSVTNGKDEQNPILARIKAFEDGGSRDLKLLDLQSSQLPALKNDEVYKPYVYALLSYVRGENFQTNQPDQVESFLARLDEAGRVLDSPSARADLNVLAGLLEKRMDRIAAARNRAQSARLLDRNNKLLPILVDALPALTIGEKLNEDPKESSAGDRREVAKQGFNVLSTAGKPSVADLKLLLSWCEKSATLDPKDAGYFGDIFSQTTVFLASKGLDQEGQSARLTKSAQLDPKNVAIALLVIDQEIRDPKTKPAGWSRLASLKLTDAALLPSEMSLVVPAVERIVDSTQNIDEQRLALASLKLVVFHVEGQERKGLLWRQAGLAGDLSTDPEDGIGVLDRIDPRFLTVPAQWAEVSKALVDQSHLSKAEIDRWSPSVAKLFVNRAEKRKAMSQYSQALADLEWAIALNPGKNEFVANRSQVRLAFADSLANNPEEQAKQLQLALTDDPKNTSIKLKLANLKLTTGDSAAALSLLEALRKEEPKNTAVLTKMMSLYLARDEMLDKVEPTLVELKKQLGAEEAKTLSASVISQLLARAGVKKPVPSPSQVLKLCQLAVRIDSGAEAKGKETFFRQIEVFALEGKYSPETMGELDSLLNQVPTSLAGWAGDVTQLLSTEYSKAGNFELRNGDFALAKKHFVRALDLDDGDRNLEQMFDYFSRLKPVDEGAYESGIAFFDKFLADPKNAKRGRAIALRGYLQGLKGDPQLLIEAMFDWADSSPFPKPLKKRNFAEPQSASDARLLAIELLLRIDQKETGEQKREILSKDSFKLARKKAIDLLKVSLENTDKSSLFAHLALAIVLNADGQAEEAKKSLDAMLMLADSKGDSGKIFGLSYPAKIQSFTDQWVADLRAAQNPQPAP